MQTYEIRDPIFGFIVINDWEREIINHPAFQRLRRIRQLSLSDMVFPGSTHSRFEHSLGVMHVATKMYENIILRRADYLKRQLNYNDSGLQRDKVLVRLAALLHDIGHAPFSHAAEELMEKKPEQKDKHYNHEDYSIAIIKFILKDIIENHELNQNYGIKAEEVCSLLDKSSSFNRTLIWRNLISSQLDADRADYLLRDSYHSGVNYGKFDLERLLTTLSVVDDPETGGPIIAVEEGGCHAAEGLITARYQMFTQVYFHHTRRAYDYHAAEAIKTLLVKERGVGTFPSPTSKENVEEYLRWDDWKVNGLIHSGAAGLHGEIILKRNHYRCVDATNEVPKAEELTEMEEICKHFQEEIGFIDEADKSWYQLGSEDIAIVRNGGKFKEEKVEPLSHLSTVVKGLVPIKQKRIYVPVERKDEMKEKIKKYRMKGNIKKYREDFRNGKN